MSQNIRIYVTSGYASVSIQNGATRETSAPDCPSVVAAMPNEDRETLRTFCAGIVATIDAQQQQLAGRKAGR
jgi:hypothetical protein